MGEPIAHAIPDGRRGCRKHHLAQHLPAGEAIHTRHLHQPVGHVLNALAGVDGHGHQRGFGDEQKLQCLIDAHHQNQQRQPANHRHLAERLEQREHVVADGGRQAHCTAQQQAQRQTNAKARKHADHADAQVVPQLAAGQQLTKHLEHGSGRRQHLLGNPAPHGGQLPQCQHSQWKRPGPERATCPSPRGLVSQDRNAARRHLRQRLQRVRGAGKPGRVQCGYRHLLHVLSGGRSANAQGWAGNLNNNQRKCKRRLL